MATPINNNTTSLQDLLAKANALPEAGTTLPALTTPGSAADLRSGKQLIDGDGNVVDGSMPDVEVPTAEQALLNSTGTIYATVTQSAGYTPGGTTTTQLDLPVQEGKTVTPTKSKQVAVSAGKWCTESVEVDAIPEEYIVPSGTLEVTANGTHDVTGYASVNVDVVGSGGGGTVETCALKTNIFVGCICATTYEDGVFGAIYDGGDYTAASIDANNIVCGSCVWLEIGQSWTVSYTGLELLATSTMWGNGYFFKVTAAAGETATITAKNDL